MTFVCVRSIQSPPLHPYGVFMMVMFHIHVYNLLQYKFYIKMLATHVYEASCHLMLANRIQVQTGIPPQVSRVSFSLPLS